MAWSRTPSTCGSDALNLWIRTSVVTGALTIELAQRLRADHPELGIVVIADRSHEFARELRRDGASGIAHLIDERSLGTDVLLRALREVRAGQTVLDEGGRRLPRSSP